MIYSTFTRLATVSILFLLFIIAGLVFLSDASFPVKLSENVNKTSQEEMGLLALEMREEVDGPVIKLASLSVMTDYPSQDLVADSKRAITDTDDRLNRAQDLAGQEKFNEALSVLKNAQSVDRNDYAVKFLEARILSWAGKHYEAEEIFSDLTREYPQDSDIAVSYGYLYLYQNKFNQAQQLFTKVLSENPGYKDAQDGLERARIARTQ